MRINTGEHEWVEVKKVPFGVYYQINFGYNGDKVDATVETNLNELRQIVAAIEKMEQERAGG